MLARSAVAKTLFSMQQKMARKVKRNIVQTYEPTHKRTQQGGKIRKTSSMNKSFKASYKKYRGQGK